MLTNKEKRMYRNLRAMTMMVVVALLVVLMGQQEKKAMEIDSNTPSVYEIAYMEDIGYTYVVTDSGVGYFMK